MYREAAAVLLADPGVDMLLTMFVPQAITPVGEVAGHVIAAARGAEKPRVGCLVGGESSPEAVLELNRHGVPFYRDPNRAARALAALVEYKRLQERPDLTPGPVADVGRDAVLELLRQAWNKSGAGFLDAEVSAQVAAAYGIHIPASGLARDVETACALADQIGYPVAMKLIAPGLVHKADVGGIALGLTGEAAIRAAFAQMVGERPEYSVMLQQMAPKGQEVILGARHDAQFGPVLMFGLGGIFVEVLQDVAFRLAPISVGDAHDMVMETAVGKILRGVRGQPAADLAGTVDTLRRVGQLVADFPCIAELDINPLIVGQEGQGVWAVDVRIALDREPARR